VLYVPAAIIRNVRHDRMDSVHSPTMRPTRVHLIVTRMGIKNYETSSRYTMDRLQPTIDHANAIWKMDGRNIRFAIDKNGDVWFRANDVAAYLGYVHENGKVLTSNMLRHITRADWKIKFADLDSNRTLSYHDSEARYIAEPGFYQCVFKSEKPNAIAFKEWVVAEVIPAIRRTGSFSIENHPHAPHDPHDPHRSSDELVYRNNQRHALGIARESIELLTLLNDGTLEDVDKMMLKSYIRNAIGSETLLLTASNSNENENESERFLMPVSDLWRELTGSIGKKSDHMRLGSVISAEYRRRHDTAPMKVERFVDGTTRMVNAYSLRSDPWIREFARSVLVL
jgi:prophage antirepressor-like protein